MNCGGFVIIKQSKDKDKEDEIIMVETRAGNYGFPKGKRNKNESNFETAVRELKQETGITLNNIKICMEYESKKYYKFIENKTVYYLAVLKEDIIIKFDIDELKDVKWFPMSMALKMRSKQFRPTRKEILKKAYEEFQKCTTFTEDPEIPENISGTRSDMQKEIKENKKKVSKKQFSYTNTVPRILTGDTQISKKLSWILRHGAVSLGLSIDKDGSILLTDILKLDELKHITVDKIKSIVTENDKQRFSLSEEKDGQLRIRANQGHSREVGAVIDDNILLKEITKDEIKTHYSICFHGTKKHVIKQIKQTGLKPMLRKHIHLTNSFEAISGVRADMDTMVHINMILAMEDGMKFYLSDNGVILTEGINGKIDPKYISKIESRQLISRSTLKEGICISNKT